MRNLRKPSAPAVAAPENEDDDLDIDDMPFSKGPAGGRARERAPMVQVNARSRDRQQLEPLPVSSQGARADDRKPIQGASKISEDGLSRVHSRQSQGNFAD